MTKKQRRKLLDRRSVIINELSKMSRDWSRWKLVDYKTLESELATLDCELRPD
jgi:hypothetical protein